MPIVTTIGKLQLGCIWNVPQVSCRQSISNQMRFVSPENKEHFHSHVPRLTHRTCLLAVLEKMKDESNAYGFMTI